MTLYQFLKLKQQMTMRKEKELINKKKIKTLLQFLKLKMKNNFQRDYQNSAWPNNKERTREIEIKKIK